VVYVLTWLKIAEVVANYPVPQAFYKPCLRLHNNGS
jgi:hypothetical protein